MIDMLREFVQSLSYNDVFSKYEQSTKMEISIDIGYDYVYRYDENNCECTETCGFTTHRT